MLVLRLSNGRNIQLFRKGTVQILGYITDDDAEDMRRELMHRCHITLSPVTVSNLVMSAQLRKNPTLPKYSSAVFFREMEVFPATLIRKWHPAHIALFHNGKVIVTGVQTLIEGQHVLESFLREFE